MKRHLALSLLVPLLALSSCKGLKGGGGTMPQHVAYVSLTVEEATHWLGGKSFSASGTQAQAAPATYHMVMKDGTWFLEESSVRPEAGQYYYNDYGSIGAAEAQGVLSAAAGVVRGMRGLAEPSAKPRTRGRKLYTLAVNSNDGGRPQVRYYESDKPKDKLFLNLLQAFRTTSQKHGTVVPLGGKVGFGG